MYFQEEAVLILLLEVDSIKDCYWLNSDANLKAQHTNSIPVLFSTVNINKFQVQHLNSLFQVVDYFSSKV